VEIVGVEGTDCKVRQSVAVGRDSALEVHGVIEKLMELPWLHVDLDLPLVMATIIMSK